MRGRVRKRCLSGIPAAPHRRLLQEGNIAPFPHVADAAGHLGKIGAVLDVTAALAGEELRLAQERVLVVVLQCCEECPVLIVAINLRTVFPGYCAGGRAAVFRQEGRRRRSPAPAKVAPPVSPSIGETVTLKSESGIGQ
jgi:hypothetical protein